MILGIGNPLRGDDGLGPLLIRRLRGKTRCALLDCGEAPENFGGQILAYHPETLLVVDAADWSGLPGEIRPITEDQIADCLPSTHGASLRFFLDYLRREWGGRILLIGIQIKTRGFMEPMSAEVKGAIQSLEKGIRKVFSLE